ncbi:hypothetical protein HJC23_002604 [Cyclotella cryptica]|uniref:Uncharacterized protein n=1 Tax=Cyclotella cryptica TaxID=29204 RepID=A0ABD3PY55_9STRA|eukprot:CCRYP_010355-RA/>CCRYP_010355-RA protein AED:0.17 eAED:0.17 QI:218/1/1/1/0/0/2/70/319
MCGQPVFSILSLVAILTTFSSGHRHNTELVTAEANPRITTQESRQADYLRNRRRILPRQKYRINHSPQSFADASKKNSTLLATKGPSTTKYIYLILHNISYIPAPKVWSLTTAQYMTDFFNSAGYRLISARVNIEYISQLDTGGQTEVLYVQNTLYETDSSSEYVNLDEIISGPFYSKKDREKYVNVLKGVDEVGYRDLVDTSIPENLGEIDFTQRISSIDDIEGPSNSTVYLFLISLGGFLLFCCGCSCFVWLGLLGWYTLNNLKPTHEEFDEDETTLGNKAMESFGEVCDEDSCVEIYSDEESRSGTNNLRLRWRLT